jgi:1-acyl-sn-glycerol-3-phosphate acyltransferase
MIMMEDRYTITYPRKRIARGIARFLGRIVLPLAFKLQITDQESFPESGPLLIVGNHVAAMEAVLVAVFTPWQVEMLGAADVPHEKVTELAIAVFGCIPVQRGRMDRSALHKALDVLRQDGVVGIFPEGGIWNARAMRPQTGVAWLSYRSGAPVLPIGFGGTLGAIGAALRMKRPVLEMNVGKLIPAAHLPDGKARKVYLEEYAAQVLDAVRALIPADDREPQVRILDERFELKVTVQGESGKPERCPAGFHITHRAALAELLHNPAVLKIFRDNLRLPIGALQDLENARDAETIAQAALSILRYLREENPYLLTYRFGPRQGEAMKSGMEELLDLAQWAAESGRSLTVTPIRRLRSADQSEEIVQTKQGTFEGWM